MFNFEGGCYAKTIRLSEKAEPEIYATTKRFGTVLENVILDDQRRPDFRRRKSDRGTRAAPIRCISFPIPARPGIAGQPKNIIMLTGRCLRRHAAHCQSDAGPGHVPLPVRATPPRVAGTEKGGHRARGDLLDLLRRALQCRAIPPSTAICCAT